jgi:hypothetical protein
MKHLMNLKLRMYKNNYYGECGNREKGGIMEAILGFSKSRVYCFV